MEGGGARDQRIRNDETDLMNYLNSRIAQYEAKLKQTQQYLKA